MNTLGTSLHQHLLGSVQALRLENALLSTDILPELGGKIWNLTHKPTGRQWLWHNEGLPLAAPSQNSSYDDHWLGGWEELFPNDAHGNFEGRELEDHGEWWSKPWAWEALSPQDGQAGVKLTLECRTIKARCEKIISLEPDQPRLKIFYRIENLEPKPIHFMFKQHLAVAVTPECRIELPGGSVTPVDLSFSTRIKNSGPFTWPMAGDADISRVPPFEEKHKEFVYVSELPESWCGVKDEQSGDALRLRFNRKIFPHTWLFMDFGGWRGHHVAVLEPCTNKPKDLGQALKAGLCASLGPGESLRTAVEAELS